MGFSGTMGNCFSTSEGLQRGPPVDFSVPPPDRKPLQRSASDSSLIIPRQGEMSTLSDGEKSSSKTFSEPRKKTKMVTLKLKSSSAEDDSEDEILSKRTVSEIVSPSADVRAGALKKVVPDTRSCSKIALETPKHFLKCVSSSPSSPRDCGLEAHPSLNPQNPKNPNKLLTYADVLMQKGANSKVQNCEGPCATLNLKPPPAYLNAGLKRERASALEGGGVGGQDLSKKTRSLTETMIMEDAETIVRADGDTTQNPDQLEKDWLDGVGKLPEKILFGKHRQNGSFWKTPRAFVPPKQTVLGTPAFGNQNGEQGVSILCPSSTNVGYPTEEEGFHPLTLPVPPPVAQMLMIRDLPNNTVVDLRNIYMQVSNRSPKKQACDEAGRSPKKETCEPEQKEIPSTGTKGDPNTRLAKRLETSHSSENNNWGQKSPSSSPSEDSNAAPHRTSDSRNAQTASLIASSGTESNLLLNLRNDPLSSDLSHLSRSSLLSQQSASHSQFSLANASTISISGYPSLPLDASFSIAHATHFYQSYQSSCSGLQTPLSSSPVKDLHPYACNLSASSSTSRITSLDLSRLSSQHHLHRSSSSNFSICSTATTAGPPNPPSSAKTPRAPQPSLRNPIVQAKKSLETCVRYFTHPISDDYDLNMDAKNPVDDPENCCGTGYSGPVRIARSKSLAHRGKKYAVKSFDKTDLCPKKLSFLRAEANIYLRLDHPSIARLFGVYESNSELHLVIEFCAGGELYTRLSKKKVFKEKEARETVAEMLLPVGYLHCNCVVHRDLKLENFLYEEDWQVFEAREKEREDKLAGMIADWDRDWEQNLIQKDTSGFILQKTHLEDKSKQSVNSQSEATHTPATATPGSSPLTPYDLLSASGTANSTAASTPTSTNTSNVHAQKKLALNAFLAQLPTALTRKQVNKLKLIDFGFAKVFIDRSTKMHQSCGSVAYVAPEVLKRSYSGGTADMWSLGVLTYMLLSGAPPFFHREESRIMTMIEQGKYSFRSERWTNVSSDAKDFVRRVLEVDVRRRMTADQALKHRWIARSRINSRGGSSFIPVPLSSGGTNFVHAGMSAGAQEAQRQLRGLHPPNTNHASPETSYALSLGNGDEVGGCKDVSCAPSPNISSESHDDEKLLKNNGSVSPASFSHQIIQDLKQYSKNSHLKRAVLCTIAHSLDSSEVAELREIFISLDRSRSGTISISDFEAAIASVGVNGVSSEDVQSIFRAIDHGDHGCIEYSQFLAALVEPALFGPLEPYIRDVFNRFDTKQLGFVSESDLKLVLGGGTFEKVPVGALIAEASQRNRGVIFEDEFIAHIRGGSGGCKTGRGDQAGTPVLSRWISAEWDKKSSQGSFVASGGGLLRSSSHNL